MHYFKGKLLESHGSKARVFICQHFRTVSVGLSRPKSKWVEHGTVPIDIDETPHSARVPYGLEIPRAIRNNDIWGCQPKVNYLADPEVPYGAVWTHRTKQTVI